MTAGELYRRIGEMIENGEISVDSEVLTSSLEEPTDDSELFTSDISSGDSPHEYEDGTKRRVLFVNSISRTPNKSTYKDKNKKTYGTGYESIEVGMRLSRYELAILLLSKKMFAMNRLLRKLKLKLTSHRKEMEKIHKKRQILTNKKKMRKQKEIEKARLAAQKEYEKKMKALEEKRKQEDLPYEPELCY